MLISATTGESGTIIMEETNEGLPTIMTEDKANIMKTGMRAEGAELLAGLQRWIERLNELGTINKTPEDQGLIDSKPIELGELLKNLTNRGYSSVHMIAAGRQTNSISESMKAVIIGLHHHILKGGLASIENPMSSGLWDLDWLRPFIEFHNLHHIVTDKCRWGLGVRQRTRLCSNIPDSFLLNIKKARCQCGRRPHVRMNSRYRFTVEKGWLWDRPEKELSPPHFAAALATAHYQAGNAQLLEIGMKAIKLANVTTTPSTTVGFNNIDSMAEKMLLRVGQEGNWEETDVMGTIRCQGFDNNTSIHNLSRALSVVTTTQGNQIMLVAQQAVTYEDNNMSTLIDPTAPAAASWDIKINFTTSTGTMEYGDYTIELGHEGAGIGFYSRKPNAREKIELPRIPFSRTDYDKKKFMAEGEIQALHMQQLEQRSGIKFTKS